MVSQSVTSSINKVSRRVFILAIAMLSLLFVYTSPTFAASVSLNPKEGTLIQGEEFIIDVLIDSEGDALSQARIVLTFDPTIAQLVEAKRNNALFDQYPAEEQSTDNDNGVVMLTGFSQSGSGTPYTTSGEPDVFARLTFQVIASGTLDIAWEHSGNNDPYKSVLLTDGSPPQNVLLSSADLEGASFTVLSNGSKIPETAIWNDNPIVFGVIILLGGIMLGVGTALWYRGRNLLISSDKQTIVVYE